jgi:hypothetical protein
MDPDPAIFVSDLPDGQQVFLLITFLRYFLHHFSKIKRHKEVTKQ